MVKPIRFFSFPSLIAALLAGILFFFSFQGILTEDKVITTGGDGIKNYFTPVWSVTYGEGTWFDGMHYPYGDNEVYTDNQPAITHLIATVSKPLGLEGHQIPLVMHWLMLLSAMVCAGLLTAILSRWIRSRKFLVLFAVLITCMAPQIDRMYAHFSLAYLTFFPLIWYLALMWQEKGWRVAAAIPLFLSMCFFSFVHLYYLLIAMLFLLVVIVLYWWKGELSSRFTLRSILITFLPFLLVFLYTKLTDPVTDRPSHPFGFFFYKASFQSVFIPANGWLYDLWHNTLGFGRTNMEGYAWVGHAGLIALILGLTTVMVKWLNRRWVPLKTPPSFRIWFSAATLVLAFAMTLPFSLGLEGLLDVIPFIQQFRSPGRFAWVFYFVFSAWTSILIVHFIQYYIKAWKWLAYVLLALWGADSMGYLYRTGARIEQQAGPNPFAPEAVSDLNDWISDSDKFQAILQLPFYHMGSEKLYIEKGAHFMVEGMSAAYATGLPLINHMGSRTSIGQSLEVSSLAGHPLIPKTLPEGFNEKDLLLITRTEVLNVQEQFLAQRGDLLGERNGFTYYRFPLSALEHTQQALLDDFLLGRDSTYVNHEEYYSLQPLSIWGSREERPLLSEDISIGFDDHGIYRTGGEEILMEVPVTALDSTTWMEVSFWSYTFNETTAYPPVKVEWLNANGEVIRREDVTAKTSPDIIGRWVRASGYFEVQPDCASIRLTLLDHPRTLINNILVRDTRENVFYRVVDGALWFNNFPIND